LSPTYINLYFRIIWWAYRVHVWSIR